MKSEGPPESRAHAHRRGVRVRSLEVPESCCGCDGELKNCNYEGHNPKEAEHEDPEHRV